MGYVDLHSHVLYGLDDGAPDQATAIAMLDAVVRLLPGVVGKTESLEDESFETGLLEYPHYTRPDPWNGVEVPEVLKSGHHAKVKAWRRAQAGVIVEPWQKLTGAERDAVEAEAASMPLPGLSGAIQVRWTE